MSIKFKNNSMKHRNNVMQLFSYNVKRLRKQQHLTQEQLAEKAHLHWTYISHVERGTRNISLCNAQNIADALGVDIRELFKPI